MVADRYSKVILTVIALELLWLGMTSAIPPLSAQAAQTEPMPVVIRGIAIDGDATGFVPVAVVGTYRQVPAAVGGLLEPAAIRITGGSVPVRVETPVKVEADRPLPIVSVPYTPQRVPGE
jgi:hypothetical protein